MSSEVSKEIIDVRRFSSVMLQYLHSREFLDELYWVVLSDLKDKSTFQKMRDDLDLLLRGQVQSLTTLTDEEFDSERKTNIVAEVCSVAYAVDTVFSKILCRHLEKECKKLFLEILKTWIDEDKLPDEVLAELQTSSSPKPSSPVQLRRNAKSEKKSPQKLLAPESKSKGIPKKITSKTKKKSKETNCLKEGNSSKENASSSVTDIQSIFSSSVWDDSEDSNASFNISFGKSSASSVSSVHTSDLSDYDDEISLSDEDGTKKKISCTDLLTFANEEVSPKLADKLNGTTLKTSSNSPKKENTEMNCNAEIKQESLSSSNSVNGDFTPSQKINDKLPKSADSQTTTSVISTKRVRKPNSKYASENILCMSVKIKERKKQNVDCTMNVDKEISSQLSPKKKRIRYENSDTEVEPPSKVQKKDVKMPIASDGKSPEKQSETPKKPPDVVRSLTSRRTAPVTLYSTA